MNLLLFVSSWKVLQPAREDAEKKEAEEGELNSKHKKAFQRSMLEAQCKVK